MSNSGDSRALDELLSGHAAVFTLGLRRMPHLAEFLGARSIVRWPLSNSVADYVVGWGERDTTARAQRYAAKHGLPYVRLEDGFIRSCKADASQPTASLVIDPLGIYYDPRTPSRLEQLISESGHDEALLQRADKLIDSLLTHRIAKYNDTPVDDTAVVDALPSEFVLVVDQLASDASVRHATQGAVTFESMLAAARAENPGVAVVVKSHPAMSRSKQGALRSKGSALGDIVWCEAAVNPHLLLERATKVYVASSQLGFEALLHGKSVSCFGVPFYAGWGLTEDRALVSRRGERKTLRELVAAAYLEYSRYVHPVTGERTSAEDIIDHLILQKELAGLNRGRLFCFGLRPWKRRHTRPYLQSPGRVLEYCRDGDEAERRGFGPECRALVWGTREAPKLRALCERHSIKLERMEDGFLRSVGLGSDLSPPRSLVLDRLGMYYDPTGPSELEQLLATHQFTSAELERSKALQADLLLSGLSKYNPKHEPLRRRAVDPGRSVLLVPGQVETDASILLGAPTVRTNLELLRRVRAARPDSYVIYKPHPDVEARNRPGAVADKDALQFCDEIARGESIAGLLSQASEVHTLTSLVGFEGLLRGLSVFVYGMPFYAGWGLTEDSERCERRHRALTVDELVAGVLLLYPRYLDPKTGYFCTAEQAVQCIKSELERGDLVGAVMKVPFGRKLVRAYRYLAAEAQEQFHV